MLAADRPQAAGPQALDRALHILKLVAAAEPAGIRLMDVADLSELPRPTAYRLLAGLIASGFVQQDSSGGPYFLGPEAAILFRNANVRLDWHGVAGGSLRRLVDAAQDVVLLTLRSANQAVVVERLEGNFPLRTHVAKIGDRHPVGVGAAWIAMLAAMDDPAVGRLLAIDPQRRRPFPGFDDKMIRKLVSEARSRGYALNPGLIFEGSWAMAVPIVLEPGRSVGAITIAALAHRLTPERQADLLVTLRREADLVSELARRSVRQAAPARG
jgi:DNA-binding IclR family transcriptional regulator